jgi:hypothetical protein
MEPKKKKKIKLANRVPDTLSDTIVVETAQQQCLVGMSSCGLLLSQPCLNYFLLLSYHLFPETLFLLPGTGGSWKGSSFELFSWSGGR